MDYHLVKPFTIKLFNLMCTGIQVFDFDLLMVGMMEEALPYSLRSTYSTLLERLYIDRFPHSELQVDPPVFGSAAQTPMSSLHVTAQMTVSQNMQIVEVANPSESVTRLVPSVTCRRNVRTKFRAKCTAGAKACTGLFHDRKDCGP